MKRGVALVVALLCLAQQPSLAEAKRVERARYVMGTTLTITVEGAETLDLDASVARAFDRVQQIEAQLSNWRSDSDVARLNRSAGSGPVEVSPALLGVLERSRYWAEETGGAFDAVLEPLVIAYDLRGEGRWPSDTELQDAVAHSGVQHLEIDADGRRVALAEGSGVDLGGIGKGFALDVAAESLRRDGIESALLNFGGQVLAVGAPEESWGWPVTLSHPADREAAAVTLLLRDASIATSSQFERSLPTEKGPLGHVIDPRTGELGASWGAASAVSDNATDADALSTALFVLGPESGADWVSANGPVSGIFLVPGGGEDALQVRWVGQHPGIRLQENDVTSGGGGAPSNEELARRIDILSAEVEDMKQGEAAPEPVPGPGLGPAGSRVYSVPRGVSIAGYGEVVLQKFASENQLGLPAGSRDQFDALRVVTYLGYKFNDHILFNSELEFEHASTGLQGEVSVEFAYLDFMLQDEIGFRGGMVLVPLGWVNEMHEPPTYLGTLRPGAESNIIPSTWRGNGVGIFGEAGPFSYRGYFMESLRSVGDSDDNISGFSSGGVRGGRQKGSKALVEDWALTARGDWTSDFGLILGVGAFTGGTAQGDTTSSGEEFTGRTDILEGHAQYKANGVWFRALVANATVDEAELINDANGLMGSSSVGSKQFGWYATLGYDVWRLWDPTTTEYMLYPFVQYERLNTQDQVPDGFDVSPSTNRTTWTLGASFYPHPNVTLKADYQIRTNKAETGVDQFNAGITYLF